jgi:zinc protease
MAEMFRCALALVLPFLAYAQIPDLAIDHSTLPNGMDLILHTDRKAPIVHLNIRIRAGSKHEKSGQFGLAHLFEHLFYQDREGMPFSTENERIGGTSSSGTTAEDFTEFYETVPASRLERILWLESNRFAQFPRNLTQKNLDSQREVVINERRQKVENGPYDRISPLKYEQSFPPGHPYQHSVGGEYADLRAITLADVRAFYTKHYTPDQIALVIVGDFDPAQAKQWVAKYFGALTPGDGLVAPVRSAPPLDAPKFIQIDERVRTERAHFVWVGPGFAQRDATALEFAGSMLSDDYSPRNLHKALGDQLSLGVSFDRSQFQDAAILDLYLSVVPGASVTAIDEKLSAELARLARDGPTAAEIERARNQFEAQSLGELETISGMASAIQRVHQFYGSIDHWHDWIGRYNAITADDVRIAVNHWLVKPSHLAIDVRPQAAVHDDIPEPDRATPPPFQPDKPYRPPEIQSAQLPNGLAIFLLERHDLPKVAVRLQFRAGALQNPQDKPGIMLLAAATGGKGNKTAEGVDIERAITDLGSNISGNADLNAQDYSFSVLRKNLEPAFRILAGAFLHPEYPDWAVATRKKDWIEEIEKPEAGLDNYGRQLYAAAFGPDHPLGRGFGTVDSIRALTAADVRAFHDRYWKPNIAALFFAGDITLKDAIALATETLGSWTGTAPLAPPMPPPAPKHDRIVFVDRKGVTQTMVVQVLPAVPRDHPDYPALVLADRIYGGMASSRIWENIRQQHGIAYYALSALTTLPGAGLWTIQSPVQQDSTVLAMREFEKELAALGRTKPITQSELDQAKTGLLRSLPEQMETLDSAVGTIAWNWAQGLPPGDVEAFPKRLAAVTLDEVNAAARKYARNDRAFFLLVGDREKITPQLRDFR